MLRKSQSGIEFLLVTGTVLFLFVLFLVAIQVNTVERNREKEILIIKNLAISIQDEINLATEASDGYIREFYIPESILGKPYDNLEIADNQIYIKVGRNAISFRVEDVIGNVKTGKNIIKKENGKVYLNQQ